MKKARLVAAFAILTIAASMVVAANGGTASPSMGTVCIRDDSASRFVTIDTNSGAFRYTNCETGVVLIGRGTVLKADGVIALLANGNTIVFNSNNNFGTAVIAENNGDPTLIHDSNTSDSVCGCF